MNNPIKSVLIVDDSRMARMFIRRCLEIIGLNRENFIEAGDGREALSKLESSAVDLVIADLNMPLMDGKALLRWMRAHENFDTIPIVFITSINNKTTSEELMELGAHCVLNKPVSPKVLAPVLEKLLVFK